MERLACSAATTSYQNGYVSWEEVFVSSDKGRREVHYFLKRRDGGSDLAVVGKEKSLRHISYHYAIRNVSFVPFYKLKSRREVVDWLDSVVLVSDLPSGDANIVVKQGYEAENGTMKENQLQKLPPCSKEFSWIGSPWTCRKRRQHYQSYKRNGFQISVYDFVFVLAEKNKRLVAYLEDMYEDSRGNKMVVVRWFHKIDEVGIVLPHSSSDREVFFSSYLQDLSIECIDGLTFVLSPQHYEKFQKEARHILLEPFVCISQFDNDDVKPFDVTQMKGYWKQDILRYMFTHSDSRSNGSSGQSDDGPEFDETHNSTAGIRPKKRQRCTKVDVKDPGDLAVVKLENLNINKIISKTSTGNNSSKLVGHTATAAIKETGEHALHYLFVGSQIEVLSQDSGIRGSWFRASIIKRNKDKLKVQYHDLQDAVDEDKKLEEWIPASRVAVRDDLGLRMDGRTKTRPAPQSSKCEISFVGDVGSVVDAWWNDGWWEGIVVQKESESIYHVYFPEEKLVSIFGPANLRQSQDWTGNGWVRVRERPDLVNSILSSLKTKQNSSKSRDGKSPLASIGDATQSKQPDTCLDSEKERPRKPELVQDISKDVKFLQPRWNSLGKRTHQSRGTSHQNPRCVDSYRKKSPKILRPDAAAAESYVIQTSLKVDHDDCKYAGGDPSIFSSSVVPSVTNLVMCR